MTLRTWVGRFLARVMATDRARTTTRRTRPFARLTLETLPDRDVPSTVPVDEANSPPGSDHPAPVEPTQSVVQSFANPFHVNGIALTPRALIDLGLADPIGPTPPSGLSFFGGGGSLDQSAGDRAGELRVTVLPFGELGFQPTTFANTWPGGRSANGTAPAELPVRGQPAPTPPPTPVPAGEQPAGPVAPPVTTAGGPVVRPNTPVFRITAAPKPREPLTVSYTLAAHDAGGTVTRHGSATLTVGARPVAITPGATVAGRAPDVLTITLREQPGVTLVRGSATVFLAPVSRIGDSTLFEAHRLGRSAEAFAALVQRHEAAVARACQGIVGNRADAEDTRQVVFQELARRQTRFTGPLTGWLRTVSRNTCLAFLRSRRRRLRYEQAAARPVAVEPSAPAGLDESLATAIDQLPAELGEAVRLRYVEGYTQQEAARIVGCPRGTLSRRAAVGLRLLRDMLTGGPDLG